MKITAKQAVAGLQLVSEEGMVARLTPTYYIGENVEREIPTGSRITIVESPRSYQGSGRCVCFRVGDNLLNYYMFWANFKKFTTLVD
jgi:hypothetical protein